MNKVIKNVIADLEVRIEETGGNVTSSSLPSLKGDSLQLRQLLQNLIGNALKYHRSDQPPRVEVTGRIVRRDQDRYCLLSVRDNGIGIQAKYNNRIFGVFQRLHGKNEYEGAGIGLAICKKIVERHHGAIEVISDGKEGTEFKVTLPAAT